MITLTPWNRDYKTAKAARLDYLANKDFTFNDITSPWDGKPVNREQLKGVQVKLRFANLRKVTVIA